MTLNNYDWKENGEDDNGYFFILSDTLHHCDYNVILVKDSGDIMVDGAYINNVPHGIAAAIAPRIDYFRTLKTIKGQHHNHHHEEKKAEKKEPEKKTEKKEPEKKAEKKSEKKEPEKKSEKKSEKK